MADEPQASDDDDVMIIEPVIETIDLTTLPDEPEMEVEEIPSSAQPDVQVKETSSSSQINVQDDGVQCCICLGSSRDRLPVTSVACGHIYCTECINRWVRQVKSCPVCRKPMKARKALLSLHF